MNLDTGKIYRTEQEISDARLRGERIAPVSKKVAQAVEHGMAHMNRHDRRREQKRQRIEARRMRKYPPNDARNYGYIAPFPTIAPPPPPTQPPPQCKPGFIRRVFQRLAGKAA